MDDESTAGSWWKTLPGVLTAIAALVTAVVGGVVGLKQAGIIWGQPSAGEARPPAHGEAGRNDRTVTPAQAP
jgi:hypothetical protein